MKILVLGADGYLGWPTCMHFSSLGHDVTAVDNFSKRRIELEDGIQPLFPIHTLHKRVEIWKAMSGHQIQLTVGDLTNHRFVYKLLEEDLPDVIIHYAEQPSAPYSMYTRENAVYTQYNNVVGNLNLLFAMQRNCPDAHLIKLGSMGEYGTPNIDIEEGYIDIEHNGRHDRLPFPKQPGSFYHLSKVHDSHNIMFACKLWNLRATDLNQGVVYGIDTEETQVSADLNTSFHYDHIFGTVINRFLVQALAGIELTVYGGGSQTRGFLDIRDTLKCVELAALNPPLNGEFRVFNQFTEQFSIIELAELVCDAANILQPGGSKLHPGIPVGIEYVENPRMEAENHYYNAKHGGLTQLGLEPHLLTLDSVIEMLKAMNSVQINHNLIQPTIKWQSG